MVVSVQETASNPYYVLKEENSDGFLMPSKKANFTRRQDCPPVYEYNGAIYLINPKSILNFEIEDFKKVRKYKMSKKYSVDLDDPIDWKVAEALMIN